MIRYLVGIIVVFVAAAFIRAVMGMITRTINDEVRSSFGSETAAPEPAKQMLRKCGACGTFKPETSMISVRDGRETFLFCSRECQRRAVS